MRLVAFAAAVPVFAVSSEVEHLTPRVPTVFEKMVLRLVDAAQGHSELGVTSLSAAFEDVLGMPDAPRLLRPCISELCALQVLVEPAAEDSLRAPLSAWRLTAQGRDFWRRGLLPRRASHEKVLHGYDLISGDLSAWREVTAGLPSLHAYLDGTPPGIDFGPLVRATLQRQRPAWLKSRTEITNVRAVVVDTRWRTVSLQLDVAADGSLALRALNDDEFDEWLRRAQPEMVWERLLAPALGSKPKQAERSASALRLSGALALSLATQEHASAAAELDRNGWQLVVLVGEEPLHDVLPQHGDVVRLRPAAPSLDRDAQALEVPQAPEVGIAVRLDPPVGLPAGLRRIELRAPGATPQAWAEGLATLYWNGQGRPVHVRAELAPEDAQAAWALVRDALGDWLAKEPRPDAMCMGAWCVSIEPVVLQWLQQTATLGWSAWFSELAVLLARLQQRLNIPQGMLPEQPWVAVLRERCAVVVERMGSRLSLPRGIELLKALRRLPLRQPSLVRLILERVTPCEQITDLLQLREALGDESTALPASLMGAPVRGALLRSALGDLSGEQPSCCSPHELDGPLQAFARSYREARREMPPILLDQPAQSSLEWQKALRVQPARSLSAIALLERAMTDVLAALDLPRDALAMPLARLLSLREALGARLAPPLSPDQRAIVIDTNVLLDVPDLLERMPAHDVPIIARAVIEELDGLKRSSSSPDPDEQLAAQRRAQLARRASRALEAFSERIVFERPRREQCAADLPPTRDNEILAVAAYYSLSTAILLSTNVDLRNTAHGEGVPAKAPQDYLKTLGKPRALSQSARDRSTTR
jgi:rRNA-processing protein FCF1